MVDPDGSGTEAKPSIKPSGFKNGMPPTKHVRGHLHGNQLGGSGDKPENLVTVFQNPVNHPQISVIEGQVRKAVKNGEVVYYLVNPKYDNDPGMPSAIQIQARGSAGFRINKTLINEK